MISDFSQIELSLFEVLALAGLFQSLYILIYITLRAGRYSRAIVAIGFFFCLSLAFAADFTSSVLPEARAYLIDIRWFFWFYGAPFGVLLILQIARIKEALPLSVYWILCLPIVFWGAIKAYLHWTTEVDEAVIAAHYSLAGLISGTLCLTALVQRKGYLVPQPKATLQKERWWLVLVSSVTLSLFLLLTLFHTAGIVQENTYILLRQLYGIVFAYLAATSLLRIYPQALDLAKTPHILTMTFKDGQGELSRKINDLINVQKVYQEESYSRADMARELSVPEHVLSAYINQRYGKSFPALMNERKIKDACRLLRETSEPVAIIASEAGFASLTTFNRVFKEIMNTTPSAYRQDKNSD